MRIDGVPKSILRRILLLVSGLTTFCLFQLVLRQAFYPSFLLTQLAQPQSPKDSEAAIHDGRSVLYASDSRANLTLPGFEGRYRWTMLHANVYDDEEYSERFLEVAAMVEGEW